MRYFYKLLTAVFISLAPVPLSSEDIQDVVNDYAQVTALNKSGNYAVVDSAGFFNICDLVLLIQMNGADIDMSNSSNFGRVESYGAYRDAGNFEFLLVSKIEDNKVYFSTDIQRDYSTSHAVQLIRVPMYLSAVVQDTLRPKAWNGKKGGVLAVYAENTIRLNAPVSASGAGFKGAERFGDETNTTDQAGYYYPYPSWKAALKGEGIQSQLSSSMQAGRGAPANGGGGGNNHNAGGGGGANAGSGGKGGLCWNKRLNQSQANDYGGLGGWSISYSPGLNKIFMGGGGGAGHSNASDNVSTKGEDGGGIIIIIADTLAGSSQFIISNGKSAVEGGNDGSGGGGGGGSILLSVNTYSGLLSIFAQGGNGGDNDGSQKLNDLVGPGGGGGGGLIWHKGANLPGNINTSVRYGFNGVITNQNVTVDYEENYGAQAGEDGDVIISLDLYIPPMIELDDVDINPDNNGPLCPQETLKLTAGLPDSLRGLYVEWKGPNGFESNDIDPEIENVSPADSGWYYVTVSVCGDILTDSTHVEIYGTEVKIVPEDAVICENDTIILRTEGEFESYLWSTGETSDTIFVTDAGEYKVTVIDSNGCETDDIVYIETVPAPQPNILPETASICFGDTVHLWVKEDYESYLWSTGDSTKKIVVDRAGLYSVTVTDSNGCKGFTEMYVELLPAPNPEIMPKDAFLCSSGGYLEIYLVGDYPFIEWFNGSSSKTLTVNMPGKYSVTVRDTNGCEGTAEIEVGVKEAPKPYIIPPYPKICKLDSVILQTEKKYESYKWSTGEISRTIIVKALGNYSVTVADEFGCEGTARTEVTEFELNPEIIGGNVICSEDSVVLETYEVYKKYRWSTGDTTPSITVFQDGIYELEVEDEKGCTGTVTVKVHIGPPPEPELEIIGPHPFCPGSDVFIQTKKEYAEYKWSSGHTTRQVKPSSGGQYLVTVTDEHGCTGTAVIEIEMYPKPEPKIEIEGENPFCENDSVILKAVGDFKSYSWSTGESGKEITVNKKGSYTLNVTDSNGCKGTASVLLRYKDLGIVIDIIGSYPVCEGDSVILRIRDEYESYLWSTGETKREIVVWESGDFWAEVTDSDGCSGHSDTVEVVFETAPDPLIHGPVQICSNTEAVYRTAYEGADVITYWKVHGGSLLSSDIGDTVKVRWGDSGTGILYVSRKFSNSQCIAYDTLEVEIIDNLKPGIFPSSLLVCEGASATISTEEGYESYEWSNGKTGTHIIEITEPGSYWVKVSAADGCEGVSDTVEIVFAEAAHPKILTDGILCPGDSLELSVSGDFINYQWSDGQTGKSIFVKEAGEYIVNVMNSEGCIGRDTVKVSLLSSDLDILPDSVNFGEILTGTESGITVELTNINSNDISIASVHLKAGNPVFEIDGLSMISDLSPAQKTGFFLHFTPRKPGKYTDSIIIEIDHPCQARYSMPVSGIGYAETIVWMPDVTAQIGEKDVCIPIFGRYNFPYDSTLLLSYETDIRFLKSLFYPGYYQICILDGRQTEQDDLILSLSGTNIAFKPGDNSLGYFCGTVLLGDDYVTPLIFDMFRWINPYIYVDTANGSLRTGGICMPGLSRVQEMEPTEISLAPNPVRNTLEAEVRSFERGNFVISVYNTKGERIKSYSWENYGKNSFSRKITFDMSRISNGLYFIVLKSPWNISTKSFILLKN